MEQESCAFAGVVSIDGGEPLVSGASVQEHPFMERFRCWRVQAYPQAGTFLSNNRGCDLCLRVIACRFLRVTYSDGKDLICHEKCWHQITEEVSTEVVNKQLYIVNERGLVVEPYDRKEISYCSPLPSEKDDVQERKRQLQSYQYLTAEIKRRREARSRVVSVAPMEEKRPCKKQLCRSTLITKEPVQLTPVVYTCSVAISSADDKVELKCDTCAETISSTYVRVKLRKGGNVLSHEGCWKKQSYKPGQIARLYRYQADGKLLEKVAFAVLIVPAVVTQLTPRVEEKIVEKGVVKIPAEYRPSWREVDVNDYASLKKKSNALGKRQQKQEKRRVSAANKEAKHLDLTLVSPPTEAYAEYVWNKIFAVEEASTVSISARPLKPEPFVDACLCLTEEEVCSSRLLSAQAKEYVPLTRK